MKPHQIILGIETSCDETSAAVLHKNDETIKILSNVISSSADLQATYGGIIPEQAAREQLKAIIPVIQESLKKANKTIDDIDAIAVTYGPGLIGSLLIGVETAKVLASTYKKPLIPVNHLIGHFYANWIKFDNSHHSPSFPSIGLLVSGGHSDLVLFKNHGNYTYLGGTRDDAAGECFDKSARLLGYPYPGGPKISKFAERGDENKITMPIPMQDSGDYDFSFSGLKTFFLNLVEKEFNTTSFDPENAESRWKRITSNDMEENDQKIADMCASLEKTIITSLTRKTIKAMKQYQITNLIVAGGVAANRKLKTTLEETIKKEFPNGVVSLPDTSLCMDNASMIASAAFFLEPTDDITNLQANPNLSLNE